MATDRDVRDAVPSSSMSEVPPMGIRSSEDGDETGRSGQLKSISVRTECLTCALGGLLLSRGDRTRSQVRGAGTRGSRQDRREVC